jgi:membrane fusion protein, multidrug efflux system
MDDQPPRGDFLPPPGRHGERPPIGEPAPVYAPPSPRRWGRRLLWLVLLAAVVAAVVWYVKSRQPAGRFTSGGPMPVGTATVQKGDMPVTVNALGTVTPLATVTVKTQLNGQLTQIAFQEGQMVKAGDFLAQIDPRPYQVALEQAEGQLAKDQAALDNAMVDLKRYQTLVAQNSVARQTLDTQVATVAQDKATIVSDQAAIDVQKLNLTYAHIIAPVGGRVGLRQVDAGNYVQTSDANGIVVITQVQPISVIFTLPEDNLPAVLKQVHAGQTLQATAFDRTGNTQLEVGQLATIDNQIDPSTGTVRMRAGFPNTSLNLFPNQFVNIVLKVDTLTGTDLVPSSAIQRGAPGTFVYVVKPDETVTAQPVTLGPEDGEKVAITKGLEPGQIVVTDGADRLKEGAKVKVTENGTQPVQPPGQGQRGQGQGGQGQGRGQGQGKHTQQGQSGAAAQPAAPGQPPAPAGPGQTPAPATGSPAGGSGG